MASSKKPKTLRPVPLEPRPPSHVAVIAAVRHGLAEISATVSAGALSERRRTEVVERVTRALAETDDDPQRLYRTPLAWIHIVEVPRRLLGRSRTPMGYRRSPS